MAVLLLAGRRHMLAAGAFTLAAGVTAWQRSADLGGDWPSRVLALLALAGTALFLLARENWWAVAAGSIGIGAVAGATWIPCVGQQLGAILTNAPLDPAAELAPMLVYVAGVCAVLVAVALIPVAFPSSRPWFEHRVVTAVGGLMAIALVAALGAGAYQDLLSEFAQLSAR